MSRLIYILWIGLVCGVTSGQSNQIDKKDFSITVLDSSDQQPIQYASVSLLKLNSDSIKVGGMTNELGQFTFQHGLTENIDLKIDFIGYQSKIIGDVLTADENGIPIAVDLGAIYLSEKVLQHEDINVLGTRSSLRIGVDKKTYSVGIGDKIVGRNTFDLLRRIPSVDVDMNGDITINGDPNIRILIDGWQMSHTHRPSSFLLDLFDANLIEKIDIITNPSVEYDPDGMGGIINIIVREDSTQFEPSLSTSFSVGNFNQFNGSGYFSFQKGRTKNHLFAGVQSGYDFKRSYREYEWFYPRYSWKSVQTKESIETPLSATFTQASTIELSDKHTIKLMSGLSLFTQNSTDSISHILPAEYTMTSHDEKRGWIFDLTGTHNYFSNQNQNIKISTDLNFSQSGEHHKDINDRISNGVGSDDHRHIYQDDAIRVGRISSKFDLLKTPLGHIKSGIQWDHKSVQSELEYLHAPYGFEYLENITSAYVKLKRHQVHKILPSIDIGLRVESYNTDASIFNIQLPESHQHADTTNVFVSLIDSTISTSPAAQSTVTFFPSLNLTKNFNQKKQSIILVLNRRVNRPELIMLHPFPVSLIDEYHVRTGNPFLKPEIVNMAKIGASLTQHGTTKVSMYYKKIENLIQYHDVDFVSVGDLYFEVFTLDNAGTGSSYGKEFSYSNQLFSGKLYSLLHYYDWKTSTKGAVDEDLNSTTSGAVASVNLQYKFNLGSQISLKSKYYFTSTIPSGTIQPYWVIDMDYTKKLFFKNFYFNCSVSDLFNTRMLDIETKQSITNPTSGFTYTQVLHAERSDIGRHFNVGISYTFGITPLLKLGNSTKSNTDKPIQIDY